MEAFRTRPLVGEHPYVWVDATYHKVPVDGHVTSQATVVAVGVTAEGERQVLGVDVGPSEDRAFWTVVGCGVSAQPKNVPTPETVRAGVSIVLNGVPPWRC